MRQELEELLLFDDALIAASLKDWTIFLSNLLKWHFLIAVFLNSIVLFATLSSKNLWYEPTSTFFTPTLPIP